MPGTELDFVYQGRALGDWLRDLVANDARRRQQAAAAIEEIRFHPSEHAGTARRAHAHLDAFDAAVRRAVNSPDFDAPAFLGALIRVLRGLPAAQGRDANAQEAFIESLAASFVFLALGEEILLAPEEIRAMLRDSRQRWNALQVIERLGPKARLFADDLFSQLDASQKRRPFDAPDALAAVIRDDADRVRGLVDRLDAAEPAVAEGAAETLYTLGPRAAELVPACVERLLASSASEGSPVRPAAIAALGRVTQGTDVAVDPLLAWSQSGDAAIVGPALTALGDIGRQPEKVVLRLIEAFDDYQEPDQDWLHYSRHERVVRALQAFGPAAVAAVPVLAAHVRREGDKLDVGVLQTLGSLGPAAREALAVVERLAEEEGYTAADFDSPDELDDDLDLVAVTVLKIRGRDCPAEEL